MIHEKPAADPLARRRAAREERILDAALGVLVEEGIEALTAKRLARALDQSVGALYRTFDGLEAVLTALQVRELGALRGDLASRMEAVRALGPLAGVLVAAERFASLAEREPARFALLARVVADPRLLLPDPEAKVVGGVMAQLLAEIGARLAAASDRGDLGPGDPIERTVLLWSSLQGLLQMRKLGRLEPRLHDSRGLARTLTDTLLIGWGADREALAALRARLDRPGTDP